MASIRIHSSSRTTRLFHVIREVSYLEKIIIQDPSTLHIMFKNLIDVHGSTKMRVDSRGFLSPTRVSNSQHGGKSPPFEPQEIHYSYILVLLCKTYRDL